MTRSGKKKKMNTEKRDAHAFLVDRIEKGDGAIPNSFLGGLSNQTNILVATLLIDTTSTCHPVPLRPLPQPYRQLSLSLSLSLSLCFLLIAIVPVNFIVG